MASRLLPRDLQELYAHALPLELAPRNAREALAIAVERRTQNFYVDVAENTSDDAMCAFAGEMAVDVLPLKP